MGSLPYFITFKQKTKEDIYSCMNAIGRERFIENEIDIFDVITFKKDVLDFKKGKSYVRTTGDSYNHLYKTFLEDVKEIKFNQCTVINDEVYWIYGRKAMEELVDIEKVEYVRGKYIPFAKSKEDIKLEKGGNIERVPGGYYVKDYECISGEVNECDNRISLLNSDNESYIYYDFSYNELKEDDTIYITDMSKGFRKQLCVDAYNDRTKSGGYIYFDESVDCNLEATKENIKLVSDSIAYNFNKKGFKNIKIMYRTGYIVEEFEKYKIDVGLV